MGDFVIQVRRMEFHCCREKQMESEGSIGLVTFVFLASLCWLHIELLCTDRGNIHSYTMYPSTLAPTMQIPSADTHIDSVCNNFGATQKQTGLHRPKHTIVWTWCQRGGRLPNAWTVEKIWNIYSQKWNRAASYPISTLIICEQFVYSQELFSANWTWEYINRSQIHECENRETEHYNHVLEISRPRSFISGNT
jgi:hypothetical protein